MHFANVFLPSSSRRIDVKTDHSHTIAQHSLLSPLLWYTCALCSVITSTLLLTVIWHILLFTVIRPILLFLS